jgi:hypothetical protein
MLAELGLTLSPNQWYNEQQLRAALINAYVAKGQSKAKAEQSANVMIKALDFEPRNGTYTLNGDTLVITLEDESPETFTRQ